MELFLYVHPSSINNQFFGNKGKYIYTLYYRKQVKTLVTNSQTKKILMKGYIDIYNPQNDRPFFQLKFFFYSGSMYIHAYTYVQNIYIHTKILVKYRCELMEVM